jgi:Tol biopolymer transport system component
MLFRTADLFRPWFHRIHGKARSSARRGRLPGGYTRDSKRLLFASDRSGNIDLWSIPVSGGDNRPSIPMRIRRDLGVIRPTGIANDQSLYYVLSQCSADVFTVGLSPTYDAALPSMKAMATRFVAYNSGPDWSPSGEEIVYQVGQLGTPDGIDLIFLDLRTGEERLVHPALLQFSRPRYTVDGKSVAVDGVGRDGVQGLYQVDGRSGAPVLLARGDGEELANPIWAASGKMLFFERGGNSAWVLEGGTGRQIELYKSITLNANFNSAPSPDGQSVAIVDGTSLLTVSSGERSREILHLAPPEVFSPFPGSLAWTADGRYILFGKVVDREHQVWRIPAAGGRPEPIGLVVQDQAIFSERAQMAVESHSLSATAICVPKRSGQWRTSLQISGE